MIALLFLLACSPQPLDTAEDLGTNEGSDTASPSEECDQGPLTSTATYADVVAQDATRCLAVRTTVCGDISRIVYGDDGLFPHLSYYEGEQLVSVYSGSDQPGECSWAGPEVSCGGTGTPEFSTACVAPTVYESFEREQELPYTPSDMAAFMEWNPCHGQGQCTEPDGTTYTVIAPHRHEVFSNGGEAHVYNSDGEGVAFYYQWDNGRRGSTWFGQRVSSCLGAALEPSDACGLSVF